MPTATTAVRRATSPNSTAYLSLLRRGTLGALDLRERGLGRPIQSGHTFSIGQLDVKPFAVPHDCREPLGFRFETGSGQLCVTTDLGWVPHNVARQFRDVDLLVLEANYDPHLLENGSYPHFLKRRVSGTYGHLSNAAAAEAIAACGDRAPRSVWLAHLSEHNNSPKHALQTVARILKRHGLARVGFEDNPSPPLEPALDQQRRARTPAAPVRLIPARPSR